MVETPSKGDDKGEALVDSTPKKQTAFLSFLGHENRDSSSTGDIASTLASVVKTNAAILAKLDAIDGRLDIMDAQIAEKASAAAPSEHALRLAGGEAVTMAEMQAMKQEMTKSPMLDDNGPETLDTEGANNGSAASGASGSTDPPNGKLQARRSSTQLRGSTGKSRSASIASIGQDGKPIYKMEAEQRERYLKKFKRAEIFGKSLDELEQEEKEKMDKAHPGRTRLLSRGMLLPDTGVRMWWDIVGMLLVFYVSIALPYQVAFLMDYLDARLAVFDFLIDVFFITDIFLNFRTAYFHDGELVTDPIAVAKHYMKLWFWIDLISSIPFDWFFGGFDFTTTEYIGDDFGNSSSSDEKNADATKLAGMVRVFKVVKLLRLLRVVRLFRSMKRWEQTILMIHSSKLRMIRLIVILLVFSHWNGCFQFMLAAYQREGGEYLEESWVARAGIDDFTPIDQWSWSFFHAATQLLAISYGVVGPGTSGEVWVYMTSMLSGAMLYAVFVATVTAFFSDSDPSARAYRSKVDMVNEYMRHAQLPRTLRAKLRSYFELRFPGRRSFDEKSILSELSDPLTYEVKFQKCRRVLEVLNILDHEDPQIAFTLCDNLQRVVFVGGDVIIREGQEASGMYFCSSGLVHVTSKRTGDEPITTLGPQSFFGEMSLLNPTGETTASVVVRTFFEGYLLSKADYARLERHHPVFRDYLLVAARLRMTMNMNKGGAQTDDKLDALLDVLDPTKKKLKEEAKKPNRRSVTGTMMRKMSRMSPQGTSRINPLSRVNSSAKLLKAQFSANPIKRDSSRHASDSPKASKQDSPKGGKTSLQAPVQV